MHLSKTVTPLLGNGLTQETFCPLGNFASFFWVATVREKCLENEKISRSRKCQGISLSVREI